jgi:hypothetical protein
MIRIAVTRNDRTAWRRATALPPIGPHSSPAPMRRTQRTRVFRAIHAIHAIHEEHGRPSDGRHSPAGEPDAAGVGSKVTGRGRPRGRGGFGPTGPTSVGIRLDHLEGFCEQDRRGISENLPLGATRCHYGPEDEVLSLGFRYVKSMLSGFLEVCQSVPRDAREPSGGRARPTFLVP